MSGGECWIKVGRITGERYCGKHGRAAGWPCTDPHDDRCEAEWIEGAYAYTGCERHDRRTATDG